MGATQGVPEAVIHSLGWIILYDPVQYCFLSEAFSKPEIHIPGWLKKKKKERILPLFSHSTFSIAVTLTCLFIQIARSLWEKLDIKRRNRLSKTESCNKPLHVHPMRLSPAFHFRPHFVRPPSPREKVYASHINDNLLPCFSETFLEIPPVQWYA